MVLGCGIETSYICGYLAGVMDTSRRHSKTYKLKGIFYPTNEEGVVAVIKQYLGYLDIPCAVLSGLYTTYEVHITSIDGWYSFYAWVPIQGRLKVALEHNIRSTGVDLPGAIGEQDNEFHIGWLCGAIDSIGSFNTNKKNYYLSLWHQDEALIEQCQIGLDIVGIDYSMGKTGKKHNIRIYKQASLLKLRGLRLHSERIIQTLETIYRWIERPRSKYDLAGIIKAYRAGEDIQKACISRGIPKNQIAHIKSRIKALIELNQ